MDKTLKHSFPLCSLFWGQCCQINENARLSWSTTLTDCSGNSCQRQRQRRSCQSMQWNDYGWGPFVWFTNNDLRHQGKWKTTKAVKIQLHKWQCLAFHGSLRIVSATYDMIQFFDSILMTLSCSRQVVHALGQCSRRYRFRPIWTKASQRENIASGIEHCDVIHRACSAPLLHLLVQLVFVFVQ